MRLSGRDQEEFYMVAIKELLPIGSVILLERAVKPLMIYGVRQTNESDGKEYDYIGVLYPEGNVGANAQFLFQHEDIREVIFRGYEDESRAAFLERLEEFYDKKE